MKQKIEKEITYLNQYCDRPDVDKSKADIARAAISWIGLLQHVESDKENGVTIKRFSIDGCLSYLKGTSNSQPSFSVLVGYEDRKIDLLHNYILSRNTTEDDIKTHIKEVFGISADKSASGVHEDNCAGNPIVGEEKERVTKGGPKAIDFRKSFSRAIGCEEKGKEGNLPITITKNEEGDRFIDSAPPKNGCIVLKGKAPTVDISLPEIEEIEEDGYVIEHPENDLVLTIRILAAPFRVDRFCISRPSTPEGQAGKLLYEDSDIIESYAKDGKKNIGEKTIEEIKDKVASIKFSVRGEDVDIKMQPEVANIDEVYKEIIAEQAKKHQMELETEIAARDKRLSEVVEELEKQRAIYRSAEKYYDGEDHTGLIADRDTKINELQKLLEAANLEIDQLEKEQEASLLTYMSESQAVQKIIASHCNVNIDYEAEIREAQRQISQLQIELYEGVQVEQALNALIKVHEESHVDLTQALERLEESEASRELLSREALDSKKESKELRDKLEALVGAEGLDNRSRIGFVLQNYERATLENSELQSRLAILEGNSKEGNLDKDISTTSKKRAGALSLEVDEHKDDAEKSDSLQPSNLTDQFNDVAQAIEKEDNHSPRYNKSDALGNLKTQLKNAEAQINALRTENAKLRERNGYAKEDGSRSKALRQKQDLLDRKERELDLRERNFDKEYAEFKERRRALSSDSRNSTPKKGEQAHSAPPTPRTPETPYSENDDGRSPGPSVGLAMHSPANPLQAAGDNQLSR